MVQAPCREPRQQGGAGIGFGDQVRQGAGRGGRRPLGTEEGGGEDRLPAVGGGHGRVHHATCSSTGCDAWAGIA